VSLTPGDAETMERCIAVGGVVLFPADTVYGLACDPDIDEAVARLYRLKGRRPDKPAAVMFFQVDLALAALPELGQWTRAALESLLPGAITALLPNPQHRFPLACGPEPGTLGLRVPALSPELDALRAVRWPVMQSSANLAGEPDPHTVEDVPASIRDEVDFVLDGGRLPGTPSTVVDLRQFEATRDWRIVRQGAMPADVLRDALQGL
jgi:L-threonylcarbamoyladenylate synthase